MLDIRRSLHESRRPKRNEDLIYPIWGKQHKANRGLIVKDTEEFETWDDFIAVYGAVKTVDAQVVNYYLGYYYLECDCKQGYTSEGYDLYQSCFNTDYVSKPWITKLTDDEIYQLASKGKLKYYSHQYEYHPNKKLKRESLPTAQEVNSNPALHDFESVKIVTEYRANKNKIQLHCKKCEGRGEIIDYEHAYVNMWLIYQNTRSVGIVHIKQLSDEQRPKLRQYLQRQKQGLNMDFYMVDTKW